MAFLVSTIADVTISTESWGITQFLYLLTSLSFSNYQYLDFIFPPTLGIRNQNLRSSHAEQEL